MNLKNLFKPKLLEARTVEPSKLEEGLAYAVKYEDHYDLSGIFLHTDGKEDILLGERWHTVSDLCVHNNWLYDSGCKMLEKVGFVIDTITGKDIWPRDKQASSIESHNGKLYAACSDSKGWHVLEVSTREKVASRLGQITALCSHEGVLYDGGNYEGLYDTFKNEIKNKKCYAFRLCSDKKKMYGASIEYDKYRFDGVIFNALTNKKIKKVKHNAINTICSYKDNVLFAYNHGTITDLTEAERFYPNKKGVITALCAIPAELAEQMKHTKNYGFSFNEVQRINPKGAIEYLTNVSDSQESRRIIEQLFNYEHVHEDVIDWLNKNEKDIMRKAAFY